MGRKIRSIRVLQPIVSIELCTRNDCRYLVVLLSAPGPFCYSTSTDPIGRHGAPILRRVFGAVIEGAPELPGDRVVRLSLDASAESLAVYLYGSAAKVRVEGESHIIESVVATEAGSPLPPPTRPGPPPFVAQSTLGDTPVSPVEACRMAPGLEPELAGCFLNPGGDVDSEALFDFRDGLLAGKVPIHLASNRRIGRVTPIPPSAGEFVHRFGPYANPAEACEAIGTVMVDEACRMILERLRGPLRRHLDSRRELLRELVAKLQEAEAFAAGRAEADILAAYQSRIPEGASHIELPDLYAPGRTRTIVLDPTLPVREQVKRRYKEVAKLERSRDFLKGRIAAVDTEVRTLTDALDRSDRSETFDVAFETLQAVSPTRQGPRAPVAVRVRQAPTYRRIDLDERWFVLVGRNDRENDEITFRVAAPEDVWMHAQHVPGSHVVLRSRGGEDNPPKSIMERAAEIAAFYSKARHATLVPVIHTRRKYVRKFKGARPGQVTCEREKTIFVEPKEPDEPPRSPVSTSES